MKIMQIHGVIISLAQISQVRLLRTHLEFQHKNRAVCQQNGIGAFFQAQQIAFHEDVPVGITLSQRVPQKRSALFPRIALLQLKRAETCRLFIGKGGSNLRRRLTAKFA